MVFNAASKRKGSGIDAELYRRILSSKKSRGQDIREDIAVLTRNLLKIVYHLSLLEGYTSCRFISSTGILSIVVGELLRRIVGRTITGF